jgi:hypothetical protein
LQKNIETEAGEKETKQIELNSLVKQIKKEDITTMVKSSVTQAKIPLS